MQDQQSDIFDNYYCYRVSILVLDPNHVRNTAEALTRYSNCIARVANNNATLSMANVDACYNLIFKGALDYYGIKQQPSSDVKDTSSEDDSEKVSDSPKSQSDNSSAKTQSEKVQGTPELYDVFR